jgi:hypothetical protein
MFEEVIRPEPQQSVASGQMIGGVVANQYDGRRRLGSFDCDRSLWNAGARRLVHDTSQQSALSLFFVRNATDRS